MIGGGPSGAFFALHAQREAKRTGRAVDIRIIERKRDTGSDEGFSPLVCRDGCNYCAGGLSPVLTRSLENIGISIPDEIISGRIKTLTVNGHWKNIELQVPQGSRMYSVFRGSRPRGRDNKYINFDSFLLDRALQAGVEIINAGVYDIRYDKDGRPEVFFRSSRGGVTTKDSITADFLVIAAGVNQVPGGDSRRFPLLNPIRNLIPQFRPPLTRKALICEVELDSDTEAYLDGDIYFIQYASKELKIEMSSLLPKKKHATIVLLGRSVDRSGPADIPFIIKSYLELPQIKRIMPRGLDNLPVCICSPNMTVGLARMPYGDRVAVIGDLAVSRLYKDGIYSSFIMAESLAAALFQRGLDRSSLRKGYLPIIRKIRADNSFGAAIFFLNRFFFSNPTLSRILYQAVLSERKKRYYRKRKLEKILWAIASGEGSYARTFASMFQPATVASILVGGLMVTFRNFLTEKFFGLNWKGLSRFPTGIHREDLDAKRAEFLQFTGETFERKPQFESMYSIKIRSGAGKIFKSLGTFGDVDRQYFDPRFVRVSRISGERNEKGAVLQYQLPFRFLNFNIVLERVSKNRHLVYRIRDGFGRGGILVFNIESKGERKSILSIYVAFDFD
ncbi:MAG: hypothetical protein MUP70_14690, partial [Candidatus Aminicenantes bacterium]|nr:hypothetical protein [Candidatus Aminicenantes bacterium]